MTKPGYTYNVMRVRVPGSMRDALVHNAKVRNNTISGIIQEALTEARTYDYDDAFSTEDLAGDRIEPKPHSLCFTLPDAESDWVRDYAAAQAVTIAQVVRLVLVKTKIHWDVSEY